MTKEEKELLLKDLCMRLPYGVIGLYTWKCKRSYDKELTGILYDELCSSWDSTEDSQFLPYLRSISSMTKEEKKEYRKTQINKWIKSVDCTNGGYYVHRDTLRTLDWYNTHHFDYRGLIEEGLALEAPEGMYK